MHRRRDVSKYYTKSRPKTRLELPGRGGPTENLSWSTGASTGGPPLRYSTPGGRSRPTPCLETFSQRKRRRVPASAPLGGHEEIWVPIGRTFAGVSGPPPAHGMSPLFDSSRPYLSLALPYQKRHGPSTEGSSASSAAAFLSLCVGEVERHVSWCRTGMNGMTQEAPSSATAAYGCLLFKAP